MAIISACRACGASELEVVLRLGHQPLANALPRAEDLAQPEATYPLDLAYCARCTLVQITETVPPEVLFGEYLYLSSFADTMLAHAHALSTRLVAERPLGAESLVVEIASNDGYLLQYYQQQGVPVLGIEPARNIARVAEERGIPTIAEFFGPHLAAALRAAGRCADVLHAHNVLAHVADLNGVVAGIRAVLRDTGVAVIEVPYLKDLLDHLEFDTIYHEHLCYFSVTALDRLFATHGLTIAEVERVPIHGGSLRVWVQQAGAAQRPAVGRLLAEEAAWGVGDRAVYQQFAARVADLKEQLGGLLRGLKAEGRRLAAYGAAAKGSTLLNYTGIGSDLLEFVVDRSPYKQGRYLPGVHVPIREPAALLTERPDYVLLLAWNFAAEILAQQAAYRDAGGQFIVPVPAPRVIRSATSAPLGSLV